MRCYSVTIELNSATGGSKNWQEVSIPALHRRGNICEQRQPCGDVGDRPGGWLRVGKYWVLTGILDLFTGNAVQTCKNRSGRDRTQAQLRLALKQIALCRHALVLAQPVNDTDHHDRASRDDAKWNQQAQPTVV